ncbi:MAG: NAD(P)H-hydrate dehydratase [Planctomycetota bacterium]|nr:MAG: NAD(P)H-hydrate dehydratase [Planctomycetota bacterium]
MMRNVEGLPSLPERPRAAHKGSFGTCALIGGSDGMLGAIFLAARAALRSGLGLCRMGLPSEGLGPAPVAVPEATSFGLPSDEGAISSLACDEALEQCRRVSVVAMGPGLSLRGTAPQFARDFSQALNKPLVLDADGINALDSQPELLRKRRAATILTPHPGEAARLLDWHNAAEVQGDRKRAIQELHSRSGAVVVLKGKGTLVFDGERLYENQTGNPGMASGGSGDVLTGIVTGLLAQGLEPFEAAQLAVAVHGMAGDLVAAEASEMGLIASDLIETLPRVWRQLG